MKNITSVILLFFILFSCDQKKTKTDIINPSETTTNPDEISEKKGYTNPVDGKTYRSEKKWKKYSPENKKIDTGAVKVEQIILLTDQNKILKRIAIEKFVEFIEKAELIVKESMQETNKKGELLVQITLNDSSPPKVNVSAKEDVDEKKMSLIYSEIEKLKDYNTSKDSVVFQTHYTINK